MQLSDAGSFNGERASRSPMNYIVRPFYARKRDCTWSILWKRFLDGWKKRMDVAFFFVIVEGKSISVDSFVRYSFN